MDEVSEKHNENYDTTIMIGAVMFASMFVVTLILCLCVGKDMLERINNHFQMSGQERAYVNVVKYDYESIGGEELMKSKLEEA
mmetsp:Transcript_19043/g.25769  ORF Transcript_19043/g.25769 Transcript_19043/m.25769 type:complete len:83 (+) Transcript_19043:669-917(+)